MNAQIFRLTNKTVENAKIQFIQQDKDQIPRHKMMGCAMLEGLDGVDLGAHEREARNVVLRNKLTGNVLVITGYGDTTHMEVEGIQLIRYYTSNSGATQGYYMWYYSHKWDIIERPSFGYDVKSADGGIIGYNSYTHPNNDGDIIYIFTDIFEWAERGNESKYINHDFVRLNGDESTIMVTPDTTVKIIGGYKAEVTVGGVMGVVNFHSRFDMITSFKLERGGEMNVGYCAKTDKYYHISAPNWLNEMSEKTYRVIRAMRKPKVHPPIKLLGGVVNIPVLEIFSKKYYGNQFIFIKGYLWESCPKESAAIETYIEKFGLSDIPDEFKTEVGKKEKA